MKHSRYIQIGRHIKIYVCGVKTECVVLDLLEDGEFLVAQIGTCDPDERLFTLNETTDEWDEV